MDKSTFIQACVDGEMDIIDQCKGMFEQKVYSKALVRAVDIRKPWTIDVVTKLLEYGADVDYIYDGYNSIEKVLTWKRSDLPLASLLLCCSSKGINAVLYCDYSYLFSCHTPEAVQFTIDHGINLTQESIFGQTCLDYIREVMRHTPTEQLRQTEALMISLGIKPAQE